VVSLNEAEGVCVISVQGRPGETMQNMRKSNGLLWLWFKLWKMFPLVANTSTGSVDRKSVDFQKKKAPEEYKD